MSEKKLEVMFLLVKIFHESLRPCHKVKLISVQVLSLWGKPHTEPKTRASALSPVLKLSELKGKHSFFSFTCYLVPCLF